MAERGCRVIADFDLLLAETSKVFRVSTADILGPKRTRAASLARHVVMAIWTDYHSFQDASNRCNRGCHSTSMWARQRVLNEAEMDASLAAMIAGISRRCQHGAEPEEAPEETPEKKVKYLEICS